MQRRYRLFVLVTGLSAFWLLSGFGIFHKKKYETPITKETLQPDKVLFDRAIHDIEHGNYETARLTLNTLINTYDSSEFLAKAKLAIADSWYREGGSHGFAQAEAEYKDFILFYPTMEEAAESQFKVCNIHLRQMEKADRDNAQAQRAEDECRQVLVQFPNSKFVNQASQSLRNVQEILASKEYLTGDFYHTKGSFPAAANRLSFVSQQYPLYSGADEALWELADSYKHMGDRFEDKEGDALTRIVRDYPLSNRVPLAKERLEALKKPVPQADPVAYAHMKYELDNRTKPGIVHRALSPFETSPDMNLAAKSGTPAMSSLRPSVPVSVPAAAAGTASGISDVTIGAIGDASAIDQKEDARLGAAAPSTSGASNGTGEQKASTTSTGLATAPPVETPAAPVSNDAVLPTNHPITKDQLKAMKQAQAKAAQAQAKAAKEAKKKPAAKTATDSATDATPAQK